MAQNIFPYNNATITIDDVEGTVAIVYSTITKTYKSTSINSQILAKRTDVEFCLTVSDATSGYTNTTPKVFKYAVVEPEFSVLRSMNLSNTDTVRAVLNGLISRLEFFGGDNKREYGVKPYNPANGFAYAEPIDIADITITPADETVALNDGSIVITLTGGEVNHEFKLLDANNNVLVDWQSSNTFNSLAPGSYKIQVKDTVDGGLSAIHTTSINAYVPV